MLNVGTVNGILPITEHAVVAVSHRIFLIGGINLKTPWQNGKQDMRLMCFDTVLLKWVFLEPSSQAPELFPENRVYHTANSYKESIYVFGGYTSSSETNDLYCFDTWKTQWSLVKTHGCTPSRRVGHACEMVRNNMYLFGGITSGTRLNDLHVLNLDTFSWNPIHANDGIPPLPRIFHTVTNVGDRIYIYGGKVKEGENTGDPNLYYYDIEQNIWVEEVAATNKPVPRQQHCAFAFNGRLYMSSGRRQNDYYTLDDCYSYNHFDYEWKEEKARGVPFVPMCRRSCVVIRSRVYYFSVGEGMVFVKNVGRNEEIRVVDMAWKLSALINIVDLEPSLKALCMVKASKCCLDTSKLPHSIVREMESLQLTNGVEADIN